MGFSAYVPTSQLGTARRLLDEQGFGPNNFVVPLREGDEAATHAGLHAWDSAAFRQALEAIPIEVGVIIRNDDSNILPSESFTAMVDSAGIEWSDPQPWFADAVMIGDERTHGGKTWTSLVDYNVWTPPVNWREVPAAGQLPDWVQPTGAGDAWPLNTEVNHNAKQWRSNVPANVWEPGAAGIRQWDDITEPSDPPPTVRPWVQPTGAHNAHAIGDQVTHDNPNAAGAIWIYQSAIDANTTEPGRDGTFDRWWTPIEAV